MPPTRTAKKVHIELIHYFDHFFPNVDVRLKFNTEVSSNSIHVCVIPLAGDRVTGTITIRKKNRGVVSDKRK